jgi:hypothetical protein
MPPTDGQHGQPTPCAKTFGVQQCWRRDVDANLPCARQLDTPDTGHMNTLGRCERTGNALYVGLVLIQQDLVSFNATGAKRYLANGVAADIEDDPGGHQFQIIAGTHSQDIEPRQSVCGAPLVDGLEIRDELAF